MCAIAGGFLGLILWGFLYVIAIVIAAKAAAQQPPAAPIDPFERLPSFAWGVLVAAAFAIFGAIAGEERMMDAFERVVRFEMKVADDALARD